MPNTHVRAVAEGLPTINRRRALAAGPGLAATLSAMAATMATAAAAPENPCETVHRLARELSQAMDVWNSDVGATHVAHIHGASTKPYPIGFQIVDATHTGDSPIMAAFRQWDALYDHAYDQTLEDDVEVNRLCEAMWALEDSVKGVPAKTPTELLVKILMNTTYGAFSLTEEETPDGALRAAARAVLS